MSINNPFDLGKNRVEALSDGLFAIAMTILVLGFKLPTLPADSPNVMVAPAILALWPAMVTYFIAFIGLGVFWILHHMVFHVIRVVDGVLLWLTILFFLFISVLPFTVQLVNDFPRAQVTPVLFGANFAIVGWLLYFQWLYVISKPRLQADHLTSEYRRVTNTRIIIAPITATLTTLICFWSVTTSLVIYVLLLPIYFVPPRRRANSNEATEAGDQERPSSNWSARIAIALTIIGVFAAWLLFRPELIFLNTRVNEDFKKNGSQRVLSGNFKGLAHETSGQAEVYREGNRTLLRFTKFSTSNGPDVHVYLVAAPDATKDDIIHHAGFINLGKMKGNEGDQNYELPNGIDLKTYRSVSLWCQRFNVNFGSCSLH